MPTPFTSMTGERVCDLAGCTATASGSYVDATDSRHIQFRVCADHLAPLRSGEIPTIVAARIDLGMMHERPALTFAQS